MTLSLGIDIGTSGVRTAVLDESGAVVSSARAAHPPQNQRAIDASLWWQAVAECIGLQTAALEELGRHGSEISRVAVDGTSGSMVLTDQALKPVSPALMYNSKGFDAEAAVIAAAGAPKGHITYGANSALSRALRLVATAVEKPAHLLHQADYIAAKLMGRGGFSDHNNALKTGFDPESGNWPGWAGEVMDAELLPEVHAVGAELGTLDAKIADGLALSANATVHAGTTDSVAAFIAASPLTAGAAVTSLGSTLAIKVMSGARIDLPQQGLYSHRLGDCWLVGGASNTGGAVLASLFSAEQLAELSKQIDPSVASELDYYPLLGPGERFPINDPNLAPRMTPRPADDAKFLHGLLESIARIEAQGYALIKSQGGTYPKVVLSAGGGAANDTFSRIRSRVLGASVRAADEMEASIGAAKLCLAGFG